MKQAPEISFVIPARDEEKTIETLHERIVNEVNKLKKTYEIIFINDGSVDKTLDKLLIVKKKDQNITIINFRGPFGKSIALQAGFVKAVGKIIITMDADLQDDPKEIERFVKEIEKGYDLVSGWKKKRFDPITKVIPSKIGNWLTRKLTKIKIHDLNCGFKAYKRKVIENINLYGELYKYIPVMAARQNFKIGEIVVSHEKRKYGKSKFGIERNLKGFLDLLTVVFLTGFMKRPGHFFGSLGMFSFFIGFIIGIYISYLRFTTGGIEYRTPLLIFGVLTMIVGIQLTTTGLIAELITNYNQKKFDLKNYVEEII